MKAISEFIKKFVLIRKNLSRVLSMNERNLHYIYPLNLRRDFPIADNKLKTKELLGRLAIPVPKTYRSYQYFYELSDITENLSALNEFVIKPASGSGGGGIVVIVGKSANIWHGISGKHYTIEDLRRHISDIIFGVYSNGLSDQAIVEQRIQQHSALEPLSPFGLADVRIIFCRHKPAMAMIRLATRDSNGTANLHQGAVGVGIDITSGRTIHAVHQGAHISLHPDSALDLLGRCIPHWQNIITVGARIAEHVPLKYIGIDVAVTENGPCLLEINARPGIEIQNANAAGMRQFLERE